MFGNNQRKHFFINKALQTRYIFYIIVTLSIVSFASALSIYFGIWNSALNEYSSETIKHRLDFSTRLREYEDARVSPQSPEQITLSLIKEVDLFSAREREILNEILQNTYKKLFPFFFALLFFIGWGSIFITHKIAGPLFRFESSLMKLLNGDLTFRVGLRKFDEGQTLVPVFNGFLDNIDGSIGKVKNIANELSALMKKKECPVECLELLAQMNFELDKYKTSKKK